MLRSRTCAAMANDDATDGAGSVAVNSRRSSSDSIGGQDRRRGWLLLRIPSDFRWDIRASRSLISRSNIAHYRAGLGLAEQTIEKDEARGDFPCVARGATLALPLGSQESVRLNERTPSRPNPPSAVANGLTAAFSGGQSSSSLVAG